MKRSAIARAKFWPDKDCTCRSSGSGPSGGIEKPSEFEFDFRAGRETARRRPGGTLPIHAQYDGKPQHLQRLGHLEWSAMAGMRLSVPPLQHAERRNSFVTHLIVIAENYYRLGGVDTRC